MTLPVFKELEDDWRGCQACGDDEATVEASGLCRPCWRVVVLGGSDVVMEAGLRACERLRTELHQDRELLAMLRELEWSGTSLRGYYQCPVCSQRKPSEDNPREHFDGCRLDALLRRYKR